MKHLRKTEFILITVLLVVYWGIFTYLNLFCFQQHVDSDIAAESLLAREIWDQKTLTPDNWAGSTERYVFGMPAIAAPFYGISGSMSLATGIACVILGIFFCVSLFCFFKWIGLRTETTVLAMLMLAALPMNGLENENQIVPFFALLFYVFADWYVLFFALAIFSFWFYRFLKEKTVYKKADFKLLLPAFVLFVSATILSAGGMHTVQIAIFPLFLYELISLLIETDYFRKKIPFARLIPGFYVLSQMGAFFISTLHHGQVDYVTYMNSNTEVVSRIFHMLPELVLKNFGYEGIVKLGSLQSLLQFTIIAFLILVGMALVSIYGKKTDTPDPGETKTDSLPSRAKDTLGYFICMFSVAAVLMILASVGVLHYYLFAVWFVAVLAVCIYFQFLQDEKKFFSDIILCMVLLFSVLNLNVTYGKAIKCEDNLKEYVEVTEYLNQNGIEYGYAEFWDANRLALVCDGDLTFGCSYYMEDLGMYWWLTNTDWYPPTLPADMKTAYVIRRGKEDGFLAQFENPSCMESVFNNDGFTVYISDTNYVTRP